MNINQCPNCGANIEFNASNCSFCNTSFSTSSTTDNNNSIVYVDRLFNNLLGFGKINNQKVKLNSIQDLLALMRQDKIDPKEIGHLLLQNNNISDLDGIEKFTNLKELNLINNKITNISSKVIDYFNERICHSSNLDYELSLKERQFNATFILFLDKNPNLDKSFLKQVIIRNEIPKSYASSFYGEITLINNLEKKYNKSEHSNEIKKRFNTFSDFVKSEILNTSYSNKDYIKSITTSKDKGYDVQFVTDINPFEQGLNNYKTKENILFTGTNEYRVYGDYEGYDHQGNKDYYSDLYFFNIKKPSYVGVIDSLEKKHNMDLNYWKKLITVDEKPNEGNSKSGCFGLLIFLFIIGYTIKNVW